MIRIDHHLHTSRYSPDSSIDPESLIEEARSAGIDVLVITEHDRLWPERELAELNRSGGPLILAGVEISAQEGHFLVYGLSDLDEVPPGVPLERLIEVVRSQDAAIIAAHPFRWGQDFEAIVRRHGPVFDAVELVSKNVTRETRSQLQQLLATTPMTTSGSSDAHELGQIGCYHSVCDAPIGSLADFVSSLRSGRVRPRALSGAVLPAGPVR